MSKCALEMLVCPDLQVGPSKPWFGYALGGSGFSGRTVALEEGFLCVSAQLPRKGAVSDPGNGSDCSGSAQRHVTSRRQSNKICILEGRLGIGGNKGNCPNTLLFLELSIAVKLWKFSNFRIYLIVNILLSCRKLLLGSWKGRFRQHWCQVLVQFTHHLVLLSQVTALARQPGPPEHRECGLWKASERKSCFSEHWCVGLAGVRSGESDPVRLPNGFQTGAFGL